MESGMIQKLNKVRCICEYAKEIFEADKLLDYDKVRFAIMQTKDLLNYISWEMTPTSIDGEKQAGISGGSQSPS